MHSIVTALAGLAALAIFAMPAHAQQPIDAPVLKPFADNRQWVLMEDMPYRIGESSVTITVPSGFVTDFASIPQPLWGLGLSPNGRYSKAAIVHDFLYWSQRCTRLEADNLLLIAMKESQVDTPARAAIYDGVRVGGQSAWDRNAEERANGQPRILKPEARRFGPNVLWADYRRTLAEAGVTDAPAPDNAEYCALGDSVEVPGPGR